MRPLERAATGLKAVILCGGQGTRIREASEVLPKPMMPIGDRPILWHIMKGYAIHDVRDFVLCLGYKGWLIKEFFLNYRAITSDITLSLRGDTPTFGRGQNEDWSVTLAETGDQTQTAGRVVKVRTYVEGDEPFMLTYGDGVSDVNVTRLVEFHRTHGKIVTVTAVRPAGRFGELLLDGPVVKEFVEKPQVTEGFINGGFFVCDGRRVWDYLGSDPGAILEHEPLRQLARDNQLAAYPHTGFWQPMDTLREFQLLNDLWTSGHAPWKTWS